MKYSILEIHEKRESTNEKKLIFRFVGMQESKQDPIIFLFFEALNLPHETIKKLFSSESPQTVPVEKITKATVRMGKINNYMFGKKFTENFKKTVKKAKNISKYNEERLTIEFQIKKEDL